MKYRQYKKNLGSPKEGYKQVRREWRRWQGSHKRWLGGTIFSQRTFYLEAGEPNIEVRPGFIVWNDANKSNTFIKKYTI